MKLPEVVFARLQLKLLSLLFAAALWLLVTLESTDEAEVPLVVQFVNTPPGLALQGGASTPLSLRITGPRTLLLRQRWLRAKVELDLAGARPGRVTFADLDRHVLLITGVRPLRVSPAKLEISLAGQ